MLELESKVAVVSGGLSGIGRAITDSLAMAGVTVAVADIAVDNPPALGKGVSCYRLDVSNPQSVDQAITAIEMDLGQIDILVNCAGIGREVSFLETSLELFDKIMAVNLRGTFLLGQAAARRMARSGEGKIINIASVSGLRGNAGRSAYGASKAAVIALTMTMATELAPMGIRVNAIAPGPIETPLVSGMHSAVTREAWLNHVPLGRYGRPNEVASAALFLASDASSYISGHVLTVDGGFMTSGIF